MMNPWLRGPALPAWPRRLLAAAAAALVLMLGVLAASPQLHHWLHPDASQPDHECAITVFHHGVTEVAIGVAVVVAPMLFLAGSVRLPVGPDLVAPRHWLRPGRAPPCG